MERGRGGRNERKEEGNKARKKKSLQRTREKKRRVKGERKILGEERKEE